MAWTATIHDVTREGPQIEVIAQLVDDVTGESVKRRFVVQPTAGFDQQLWLKRQVLATIASITPAQAVRTALVRGAAIDLTPEVPDPPPVDPDPTRTTFLTRWRRFESWKRAVDAGVAPNNQAYTDERTALAALWLARYVGLV